MTVNRINLETQAAASADSPELLEFLEKEPEVLRPVVRRHGVELFVFCKSCGTVGFAISQVGAGLQRAITLLEGANARRSAAEVASQTGTGLRVFQQLVEGFAEQVRLAKGFTVEQVKECHQDIERACLLLGDVPINKPGLILPTKH